MDWVDIVIGGYLVLGIFSGLRRGLMIVLFSLAGYILGVVLASHYDAPLSTMLMGQLPLNAWVHHFIPAPALASPGSTKAAFHLIRVLIGLIVFLLVIGVVELIGRWIGQVLTRIITVFRITGVLNRLGGGVVGLAEHGVVVGVVLTVVMALPMLSHSVLSREITHAPLASTLILLFGHVAKLPGGTFL